MTNRRFPVLGSDPPQTIPWAVAEEAVTNDLRSYGWEIDDPSGFALAVFTGVKARTGLTEAELDAWAPGWRDTLEPR